MVIGLKKHPDYSDLSRAE